MERRISCSADAGAEHEKALIAPIQLSALKRNVTHAAREVEAIQKHSVRRSFTSGLASVKLLLALEPVSHSVLEGRPEFCFLVEKGEGERDGVPVGLHLPVRSARPGYTGCCLSIYDSRRQHCQITHVKMNAVCFLNETLRM